MFHRDPLSNSAPLIRQVYAYVAYRVGRGPKAEDITSEVFERAVRYRESYDSSRSEPIVWLLGIARRCIQDAALRPSELAGEQVWDETSEVDLERSVVRRLTLAAAISKLDERGRELIALRYGADLPTRDVARIVGLQPNAVDVAVHRALGRLRAELEEQDSSAGEACRDIAGPATESPIA